MKKSLTLCLISLFILSSCSNSGSSTWENVKTAGRYLQKGFDSLCGADYNSYVVANEEDFIGDDDEFIPLSDKDLKNQFTATDNAIAQPKYAPGDTRSGIPNMRNFKLPNNVSSIFRTLHFETDNHVIRDKEDLVSVQKIARYMKKHPKTYLCIEGHCDQRASAAYNMALGTRRANHIRVLLIKNGVDFNRIYTISYGKEKPIAMGSSSVDWSQNRRAQFKIYDK